ncbi:glycosyltransferase family 2 protein [Candidatus Fermentibacterales bacterium]|nr:glycosyltransferase family 2 protein [Candidatus Fermentibacterales bacterium]
MDLSLVVIARNEERDLGVCLGSVPFALEKLVVDSGSTDRTRELASGLGARVLEHDFESFGAQKQWALEQARCEFVLSLDADEALSPDLAASIERICIRGEWQEGVSGYRLRRRTCYMGRLLRRGPWSRDWPLRLFRRAEARFEPDLVHEKVVLRGGGVARLHCGHVVHRPYDDLEDHMRKMTGYAALWARQQHLAGRRAGLGRTLAGPVWRFFSGYLVRGGFLEGLPGLMASWSSAQYAFLKWSMLRELNGTGLPEAGCDRGGEPAQG